MVLVGNSEFCVLPLWAALVFLVMNQKGMRSKTVPTFRVRAQVGQGPLVSLFHCGQIGCSWSLRGRVGADPGNSLRVPVASTCVPVAREPSAECRRSPGSASVQRLCCGGDMWLAEG